MANIEMNYYNGSTYETLYPTSISNLIQLSETLLDRLGLDNGTIDDIISNSSIFVQATTGCIFWYASQTIPEGFLLCDGSLISRSNYAGLFAIIGTTFGAGDGNTTFGIPDLRAKFIRGAGSSNSYNGNFAKTYEATSLNFMSSYSEGALIDGAPVNFDKAISRNMPTAEIVESRTYDRDNTQRTYYFRPYNIALTPIIKY